MNKAEIAEELRNTLDRVKCEDCPLDEICTFLIDGDSDFDSICDELENKAYESEEK